MDMQPETQTPPPGEGGHDATGRTDSTGRTDAVGGESGEGGAGTGEPEVDTVLESMEGLEDVPVSEHVEAFEDAHRRLHETLLSAGEESSAGEPDGQGP